MFMRFYTCECNLNIYRIWVKGDEEEEEEENKIIEKGAGKFTFQLSLIAAAAGKWERERQCKQVK